MARHLERIAMEVDRMNPKYSEDPMMLPLSPTTGWHFLSNESLLNSRGTKNKTLNTRWEDKIHARFHLNICVSWAGAHRTLFYITSITLVIIQTETTITQYNNTSKIHCNYSLIHCQINSTRCLILFFCTARKEKEVCASLAEHIFQCLMALNGKKTNKKKNRLCRGSLSQRDVYGRVKSRSRGSDHLLGAELKRAPQLMVVEWNKNTQWIAMWFGTDTLDPHRMNCNNFNKPCPERVLKAHSIISSWGELHLTYLSTTEAS